MLRSAAQFRGNLFANRICNVYLAICNLLFTRAACALLRVSLSLSLSLSGISRGAFCDKQRETSKGKRNEGRKEKEINEKEGLVSRDKTYCSWTFHVDAWHRPTLSNKGTDRIGMNITSRCVRKGERWVSLMETDESLNVQLLELFSFCWTNFYRGFSICRCKTAVCLCEINRNRTNSRWRNVFDVFFRSFVIFHQPPSLLRKCLSILCMFVTQMSVYFMRISLTEGGRFPRPRYRTDIFHFSRRAQ